MSSSSNLGGYFNDVKICWKDSPKALPIQLTRELIKNNVCAKFIREMDKEKNSPKKSEDSPIVFRSRTLLPRKKEKAKRSDGSPESPKSRARKNLRTLSKKHQNRYKENLGIAIEEQEKNEKSNLLTESQAIIARKLEESISQSAFISDLLKQERVTSTQKIFSDEIVNSPTFRDEHFSFSPELLPIVDNSVEGPKQVENSQELRQNQKLVDSFGKAVTINSNEIPKGGCVQQLPPQDIRTTFQKPTCANKKLVHKCGLTDSILEFKKAIGIKGSCNCESQPTSISPEGVDSKNKCLDDIDDDFYDDLETDLVDKGKVDDVNLKNLPKKETSNVPLVNNNKNLGTKTEVVNRNNVVKVVLIQREKCNGLNNENEKNKLPKTENLSPNKQILRVKNCQDNVQRPNVNIKELKPTDVVGKKTGADLIEDDFYDDIDEFPNAVDQIKIESQMGSSRKRKSESSLCDEELTSSKKAHLEGNNISIDDDFYDDDLDFDL